MTTIAERYELLDRIGSGAMGDVYRATDLRSGETVAIKHLKPDLLRYDPHLLARFQREGEALRELDHPNIVTLLNVISEDGGHYLVMEYVSDGDLTGLVKNALDGMPPEQVLSISLEIADALTRAHHLGIIHRDLKPANVLIAGDGTPRLSDFGIALRVEGERLTDSNVIIGTLDYIAPEAINGEAIDTRADVWSFGVMLFEMLAGRRPFRGDTAVSLLASILNEAVPDLEVLRPECPIGLVDLVYRMLEKDPLARITSVRYVGVALEDLLHDRTPRVTASRFAAPVPDRISLPTSNLPAQTTPFVGRESELDSIVVLLTDETQRLITILGPGGMGKSRLAVELGLSQLDTFKDDGAFFVDLAKINNPANIPAAIAEATGFPFSQQGTPHEQILNFLSNKHMLLILDNFEHLLDGRDLVSAILGRGSEVSLLITTRERLNMVEETVFNLDPLDFPNWETPEDALEYAAVQLFMQSAKRVRADFELPSDDLDYLARICRLVEGIPLGILLAAAWVDTLSLQEIAEEIQASVDFLESAGSNLPARQRSTRAAFEYSWKLLTEEERSAFARMSVFRGGCTRQAAQAVTGTSLRMLAALVNKSLLRRDHETGRFHIHELLRQFGEEQLEAVGEADAIHEAHMTYCLTALAERAADLKGRDQVGALDDIGSDFENVRAAWQWALQTKDVHPIKRATESLALYCRMRSRLIDGEDLLGAACDQLASISGDEAEILRAWLTTQGEMLAPLGKALSGRASVIEEALEIARKAGDRPLEAFAVYGLGWVQYSQQDFAEAIALYEESLGIYEVLDDRYYRAQLLHDLGRTYLFLDDRVNGEEFTQKAADLRRAIGDLGGLATSLNNLGQAARFERQLEAEESYYQECLAISKALGNPGGAGWVLSNLADLYVRLNRLDQARQIAEEALTIANRVANPRLIAQSIGSMAAIAICEEDYERAAALEHSRQALDITDVQMGWYSNHRLALTAIGRDRYQEARQHVTDMLPFAVDVMDRADSLLIKAFFFAHEDNCERAAELVSLYYHMPWAPPLSEESTPLFRRLAEDLRVALGDEAFDAAWARGKVLDADGEFEKEFGDWLHDDDR